MSREEVMDEEISRSLRYVPPAHFTFKIENFSLLSTAKKEIIESNDFDVGGCKWRLSLYPNGNKKRNGFGFISLYLVLSKSSALPLGSEVNVNFKLFVYNHIEDKYLTIQDARGTVRRFHGLKTEWGFDQLLPLDTFNDASQGYLIDDCCIFGAEIFIIKPTGKGECLSMVKEPDDGIYTWSIEKFSALDKKYLKSAQFSCQGYNWSLSVYPKGDASARDKYLSLFLAWEDSLTNSCGRNPPYAEYTLRVRSKDQLRHFEREGNDYFDNNSRSWGYSTFMTLDMLNDISKGFLVEDTLTVEVQINRIMGSKELS